MQLAVIGTGNVGRTLGARWSAHGHRVVFGTRDPAAGRLREILAEAGEGARAATPTEAAAGSEIVVLATPWQATRKAIEALGDLSGKVVVDCTNPLEPDLSGLDYGDGPSGGERVASWAAGARVVKAFNTTGTGNMANPAYGGKPLTMLICGDDGQAKERVSGLARDLGFEAVDAGPLASARLLEHLALLWIRLAYEQGLGLDFGLTLVRR